MRWTKNFYQQKGNYMWKRLLLIITVASSIRLLYLFTYPEIIITNDTRGYYEVGQEILSEKFPLYILNPDRTPIYPLFLNSIILISGYAGAEIFSKEFFESARFVVFAQMLLGIIVLILLYEILITIAIKPFYSLLFTLFISLNYNVFSWEKALLSESLTIFWLIFHLFILVKVLTKGSSCYYFLLFFSFLFGFLLKPIYVAFPFATLLPLCLWKRKPERILKSMVILFAFATVVISYLIHNAINFQYVGINKSLDFNMLGIIISRNISIEKEKNFGSFSRNISYYRSTSKDPDSYKFTQLFEPDIYYNPYRFRQLQQFNHKVIGSNLIAYTRSSIFQIPSALLEARQMDDFNSANQSFLAFFFLWLFKIYKNFQYITFIILLAFPITIVQFLKKSSFELTALIILGTISIYQILFSVFFSYSEYDRLLVVAQPIIYLFCFYWLGRVITKINFISKK